MNVKPQELIDAIRKNTQELDVFLASVVNVYNIPSEKPTKFLQVILSSLILLEDSLKSIKIAK